MEKHILVISQYFYPEQFRINDMCKEWIKRGYKITVLTGIPNYPQGKFFSGYGIFSKRKEIYKGIEIIRLPIIARGSNSFLLSLNYISFVISGFIWKLFSKLSVDSVFIYEVSPMTQALPGIWFAKKYNIPCFLYVLDLWPENVVSVTGISNRTIISMIDKMVSYIYGECNLILTPSRSFKEHIKNNYKNANKIVYWPQYAEDFYSPENGNRNEYYKFRIIFTGNIGEAQGLDILIDAGLQLIDQKNKIEFIIVGDGRYKGQLIEKVKENELEDMFRFLPQQPPVNIPKLLSEAEVAFLSLSENPLFSLTIPAKLQSYMACGIPIIASAMGETKDIIENAKCGLVSTPNDSSFLVGNIIKLMDSDSITLKQMGENARKYYTENFDKQKLLDKIDSYFIESWKE